ncbi:MAG TPA: DUF3237 domain-containing protein [Candidatus Sulfotelmatobacter sp.]|nr:DUF3237 domain-containing protein [Candidatus Sulfotelmatobacter sp.]
MTDFAPTLDFVFEARVSVAEPVDFGDTPRGFRRRIVPITGGTVDGPRLRGRVLPGGGDWQTIRPDGTWELDARYALEAEDGTPITVVNHALRHAPPAVMARLSAGESVPAHEYYFRGTPHFDVAAGPHDWLTRTLFVATGERLRDVVIIRVFAVG